MSTFDYKTIKENLEKLSTDDLHQVWLRNDPAEYTPTAFEAIRDILEERDIQPEEQTIERQRIARETLRAQRESKKIARKRDSRRKLQAYCHWRKVLSILLDVICACIAGIIGAVLFAIPASLFDPHDRTGGKAAGKGILFGFVTSVYPLYLFLSRRLLKKLPKNALKRRDHKPNGVSSETD